MICRWTNNVAAAAALGLMLLAAPSAHAVPSFARQTGMACEACHTVFPELTPFGREFKLNGYLIDNLPQVKGVTASNQSSMTLNQIPPLSLQFIASYTKTKKAFPDPSGGYAQNGSVLFPDQASLFYAGRIAPKIGAFIQITYSSADGTVGWDNTDIRYADRAFDDRLVYGLSLNNNPTVQDIFNSTPAWRYPFSQMSSATVYPPSTVMDGALSGQVAGLTAYGSFDRLLYAEFGAYRNAPQGFKNGTTGGGGPVDSSLTLAGTPALQHNAPYARVALRKELNQHSFSVGGVMLNSEFYPPGATSTTSGLTNVYKDTALDAQYQYIGDDNIFSATAIRINEKQTLNASVGIASTNSTDTLNTTRIGGSYVYKRMLGVDLGYFSTTGSSDALLYNTGVPVTGSAAGSPDSKGYMMELSYYPWQNVKLALQYTAYQRFLGGTTNYDGYGRNASDNNSVYLYGWLAF